MARATFIGLRAASKTASQVASAASNKRNTKPELELRRALTRCGLRGYRIDLATLPGRPDVAFPSAKVAVFCDGDFWHGRDLPARVAKLESGHNAPYWVAKISGNVARDRRRDDELAAQGWLVLRYWESDIKRRPDEIAAEVRSAVEQRKRTLRKR